jgi:hypothetical protein
MKGLKVRHRQHHYLCVNFAEKSLLASEYSFYFEAFVKCDPLFLYAEKHNSIQKKMRKKSLGWMFKNYYKTRWLRVGGI